MHISISHIMQRRYGKYFHSEITNFEKSTIQHHLKEQSMNYLNKQAHHFVSICSVKTYPIFSWWNIHVLYYIYQPDLIRKRRSRKIIIKISVFNAILFLMQLCFDQIMTWKSWQTLLHILDLTLMNAHCLPLTTNQIPFTTKPKFIHVLYEEILVLLWQFIAWVNTLR